MYMRITVMSLLLAVTGCSSPSSGQLTEHDRRAATTEISAVLDSMNTAWRHADFAAASRPFLDDALMTFNGYRESGAEIKANSAKGQAKSRFSGQYVADYTPRYDILTRDLAVTTWENDFARIAMDGTQGPMQVAYMTIVWKRTSDGWHILAYHESTRPKAQKGSGQALAAYTGVYRSSDGPDLRFTVAGGALDVSRGGAAPVALATFTDPNFGMDDTRMSFVRNHDGTVQGVFVAFPDGSSRYAWRVEGDGGN